ncbi:MAG TPA: response regulator transcription factor [Moraxellaceae bacterium]
MKLSRVLVVEDLPEVNAWLLQLMRSAFPGVAVHSADSVQAAQKELAEAAIDLVLLDLGLPDGSGLDIIRQLQAQRSPAVIIVMTVHDDDEHLFRALAAGAQGYLLKEQDDAQLIQQLRQMEQGQPPLSPRIARRMLAHFQQHQTSPQAPRQPARDSGLSPRESEVLAYIARGLRVAEVAQQLGLTPSTVASYIKSIYFKLNISSRAEAAIEASRRGLA